MVDADQLRVLQLGNRLQVLHQFLVVEDLANLNALFHVFIGIEWRNARLGGAVGLVRQAHLLQRIELNVIGHQHLRSVGNQQLGHRRTLGQHFRVQFLEQLVQIQRHAHADDVGRLCVEHAAGQQMQCGTAEFVDDGVACVRSALETNHDIGLGAQHIRDLALALVAPAGADNRSNHDVKTS